MGRFLLPLRFNIALSFLWHIELAVGAFSAATAPTLSEQAVANPDEQKSEQTGAASVAHGFVVTPLITRTVVFSELVCDDEEEDDAVDESDLAAPLDGAEEDRSGRDATSVPEPDCDDTVYLRMASLFRGGRSGDDNKERRTPPLLIIPPSSLCVEELALLGDLGFFLGGSSPLVDALPEAEESQPPPDVQLSDVDVDVARLDESDRSAATSPLSCFALFSYMQCGGVWGRRGGCSKDEVDEEDKEALLVVLPPLPDPDANSSLLELLTAAPAVDEVFLAAAAPESALTLTPGGPPPFLASSSYLSSPISIIFNLSSRKK